MTDAEDKTGRHGRGWADKIPLVALLAFVAVASGALVEAKFTRKAIDELAVAMKEHAAAESARLKTLEEWRLTHEATSGPLMQNYLDDLNKRRKR